MQNKRDYLAVCLIGAGSSYGRSPDKEEAIAICKRQVETDWSSLFELDGETATINVFDVTGHPEIYWDARGLHSESDPDAVFEHELREVTLSVPKQRKRRA